MKRRRYVSMLCAALLTATVSAFRADSQSSSKPSRQTAPKAAPPSKSPEPQEKTINFKADQMSRRKVGDSNVIILIGHVWLHVPEDDFVLTADRAEVDEDTQIAKVTGNVTLVRGEETTLTGDALTVNFDDSQVVVTGQVRLGFKSKPKPANEAGEPGGNGSKGNSKAEVKTTTLTCERLEYNLDDNMATATGKLQITYDTGSATADKAVLMEEDKLVTLEGNVRITDEGENKVTVQAHKATVNIETGQLDADNPMGGFTLKREAPPKKSEETKPPEDKGRSDTEKKSSS